MARHLVAKAIRPVLNRLDGPPKSWNLVFSLCGKSVIQSETIASLLAANYNGLMRTNISASDPPAGTLVIVGVGLIGGSIARTAREQNLFRQIIGIGRDSSRLQKATEQGVIDQGYCQFAEMISPADVIVVCTPVDRIAQDVIALQPYVKATGLITDAGSTKQKICSQVKQALGTEHRFVGAHPLAGSEKNGFEHALNDLYSGATVVLTPDAETPTGLRQQAVDFWQSLGGNVVEMSPAEHDQVLAKTSHLPHLVASALAASIAENHLALAASGYADTTRIAAGDPQLWSSIFRENAAATITAAEDFLHQFQTLLDALKAGQTEQVTALLETGKRNRDAWQHRDS